MTLIMAIEIDYVLLCILCILLFFIFVSFCVCSCFLFEDCRMNHHHGPPLLLPHLLYAHYVLRPRTPPNSEGGRPALSPMTPSPPGSPFPESSNRRQISDVPSLVDQAPYPAATYDATTCSQLAEASKKLELLKLDRELEEALENAEKVWETVKEDVTARVMQRWEEYKKATLRKQAILGECSWTFEDLDSDEE